MQSIPNQPQSLSAHGAAFIKLLNRSYPTETVSVLLRQDCGGWIYTVVSFRG